MERRPAAPFNLVYSLLNDLVRAARLALFAPALAWVIPQANAEDSPPDAVDLRQGDHMNGACQGVEQGEIIWRSTYGDAVRIPLSEVRSVHVGHSWEIELRDGERVRGTWQIDGTTLVVNSNVFGRLRFPADLLVAAVPAVAARGVSDSSSPPTSPVVPPVSTAPSAASDAPPGGTASNASPAPASGSTAGSNEAPPTSLQSLLRESSVLLRPGEWDLSTSLQYQHDHTLYSPEDVRGLGLDVRGELGLTSQFEVALDWPVNWLRTSTLVVPTSAGDAVTQTGSSSASSGNPELSGSTMILHEGALQPETELVTGLTIPANSVGNGGLFQTRLGLEFLKTSDPGAIFGGFGWDRQLNGWSESIYRLRNLFTYHVGVAIGLNDELAVGLQAQGEYVPDLVARGGSLVAVSVEPVVGKFWFNYRLTRHAFVEFGVVPSLNDDSDSTGFEFTYLLRY